MRGRSPSGLTRDRAALVRSRLDGRMIHVAEWLDGAIYGGEGLTKWEVDFITSISDQLDRTGFLSERQIDILERIYSERTK